MRRGDKIQILMLVVEFVGSQAGSGLLVVSPAAPGGEPRTAAAATSDGREEPFVERGEVHDEPCDGEVV